VYDAEFSGDGFGIGRSAGDINGDGRPDMFLAAFTNSQGASAGGKGYLFSGRDQGLIRSLTGTTVNGQLGFDAVPVGDVNQDGFDDYLLTGLEIAFTIAGTDAAPGARIDSVCALLAAVPDDAYAPHAQVRRNRVCARLADASRLVEAGRYLAAGRVIEALVLRRMDAVIGGQSDDDWIVAPEWQQLVVPWVQGIKTMTVSLHEDRSRRAFAQARPRAHWPRPGLYWLIVVEGSSAASATDRTVHRDLPDVVPAILDHAAPVAIRSVERLLDGSHIALRGSFISCIDVVDVYVEECALRSSIGGVTDHDGRVPDPRDRRRAAAAALDPRGEDVLEELEEGLHVAHDDARREGVPAGRRRCRRFRRHAHGSPSIPLRSEANASRG
jgi:hypothetical protein